MILALSYRAIVLKVYVLCIAGFSTHFGTYGSSSLLLVDVCGIMTALALEFGLIVFTPRSRTSIPENRLQLAHSISSSLCCVQHLDGP